MVEQIRIRQIGKLRRVGLKYFLISPLRSNIRGQANMHGARRLGRRNMRRTKQCLFHVIRLKPGGPLGYGAIDCLMINPHLSRTAEHRLRHLVSEGQ